MTIYDILSIFIAVQVKFLIFPNFMTFYDFMTVCGSSAFIKEEHFGRTDIQLLFSRSFPGVFQEFFQESNCIPGVSRSFQELPGVASNAASLQLWSKGTLSLMLIEGFTENSSFKVHLQRDASLLERIRTMKLRRQLNQKYCAFSHEENMQKNIPSQQNYVQTNCSNIAPMLF